MSKRILIVDDNKMLSKLLAKKIEFTFKYEVDIAFDYAQTAELIAQNNYFLSFVDLCLPDALNGETIDFLIGKNIPVVVLTANNDKKSRDEFMENKEILDYIFKEDDDCIEQILNSIKRLKHCDKTKIIVAMPKLNERNQIKKYLSRKLFNVLLAAHGEEALSYLQDNDDVKMVICDVNMPVINGINFLKEVRKQYDKNNISVVILGEKDDSLEAQTIKEKANDFIIKPFNKDLFYRRLDRVMDHAENTNFLRVYKDIDHISGLKNYNSLVADISDYLSNISKHDENFAFAFLNIDELSVINDEYGYNIGDDVVKICANEIKNETKGCDIIGRYDKERFCIVLKNLTEEKAIKIFLKILANIRKKGILINLDEIYFTASIGYVFANSSTGLKELTTKANEALISAKTNGKDRVEVCS
ncbi:MULTISPECIES: response regulator [unclassified Campylobacter]|uniref:bile resistance response regulator CbrR n=1 Tax=unclassified Campylobacter TaxID=2593542 RepID=UPI001237CBAE|nr:MULTISPECIES: response regulator [unclassified Campylobacter]KAA6226426.1 response regulator [Campylobacter sp. LR286c]KAA6226536.1 response regulator [Campylobacter sp. LR185c]KAA6226914.1 response regulator [Campylobacter sp. LR196d]KAA6233658.1 response regulator [Campylobacter sp. LR291e]KAA6233878.1 response regulator [Campylobacter sp. LR264d]